MSVTLTGLRELEDEISRRVKKLGPASTKGMADITFDLLGKAVAEAPVDTGDLRSTASALVNGVVVAHGDFDGSATMAGMPPPSVGGKVTGEVRFEEPYAVIQHEEFSFYHPKGGKAKYLEDPLDENMNKYVAHLGSSASDAVQGKAS